LLAAGVLAVMTTVAGIDLRHRLIPNVIVGPAFACVLLFQLAFASGHAVEWLAAAVGAPLALLAMALIDRRAVGMGDVKLAGLLGAALGLNVVSALLVASCAVVPVALVILIRGGRDARRTAIPFAPFLALGAAVVLLG
jgi:leader peptidase (prepilin peptidase)/N-methyltransferase